MGIREGLLLMLAPLSLVSTCKIVVQREGADSMCLLREHVSQAPFPLRFPYLQLDALAPGRGKRNKVTAGSKAQ